MLIWTKTFWSQQIVQNEDLSVEKMPPKKGKDAKAAKGAAAKAAMGPPPKPKKIPPPPACFTTEDLARYKEIFKAHDEEGTEKVYNRFQHWFIESVYRFQGLIQLSRQGL